MTAQIAEILLLDGVPAHMLTCPPLPLGHPRLCEVPEDEARRDGGPPFSTACWRRYVATWAIRNEALWLVEVAGKYRLEGAEPLIADWFSGSLRVPRGEILRYVHMGFETVFEEDLWIDIQEGKVTATRLVDNRGVPAEPRDPRDVAPPAPIA